MRFLGGLFLGLILGIAGFFIFSPGIEKKAFEQGIEEGRSKGIEEGILQAETARQKYEDSLKSVSIVQDTIVTPPEVTKPQKRRENNDINFRMYGNEVGERISDSL